MIDETEPRVWENNQNCILQKDQWGNNQNHIYYDSDSGFQVGPNNPRLTGIFQVPLNLFRPHVHCEFDETSLDERLTFSPTGSGSYALIDSNIVISTGTTNGSGGELTMPKVPAYFVAGQKIYFYLQTTPNGNIDLEFGIKYDSNNLIRFRRVEDDTAQQFYSETRSGGTSTTTANVGVGNSVRRLYCIHITSTGVDFYSSDDGGTLNLEATHTTNIPTGTGHVYLKFLNRYAANRTLKLDDIYFVRIK